MILSDKQLTELSKLQTQIDKAEFISKAPRESVEKVKNRIAELLAIQDINQQNNNNNNNKEYKLSDYHITHKIWSFRRTSLFDNNEEISIEYEFPNSSEKVFLGYYPTLALARKTLKLLDSVIYPDWMEEYGKHSADV
jgi:hypothetical protein